MSMYSVQARGPLSSKYAEQLVEDCTNHWLSGRQEWMTLNGDDAAFEWH